MLLQMSFSSLLPAPLSQNVLAVITKDDMVGTGALLLRNRTPITIYQHDIYEGLLIQILSPPFKVSHSVTSIFAPQLGQNLLLTEIITILPSALSIAYRPHREQQQPPSLCDSHLPLFGSANAFRTATMSESLSVGLFAKTSSNMRHTFLHCSSLRLIPFFSLPDCKSRLLSLPYRNNHTLSHLRDNLPYSCFATPR